MVTVSGWAAGGAVEAGGVLGRPDVGVGLRDTGGGATVGRVGVGVGGRPDVVEGAGVPEAPAVPDPPGAGVPVGVGVPEARDVVAVRVSAGIAMSAPMTKKTAAMTTLGNCIASSTSLPRPGEDAERPLPSTDGLFRTCQARGRTS
jgi:hypothetical protein